MNTAIIYPIAESWLMPNGDDWIFCSAKDGLFGGELTLGIEASSRDVWRVTEVKVTLGETVKYLSGALLANAAAFYRQNDRLNDHVACEYGAKYDRFDDGDAACDQRREVA